MRLQYIYTGSWFPRTKLHLREIYNFLKHQFTELAVEREKLLQLLEEMDVKDVVYLGGIFDKVTASVNELKIEYEEDGLLLLKKKAVKWPKDHFELENFYQEKLTPFLYGLFSKGAPSLEMVRTGIRLRPTIAVATQAGKDEIKSFFAKLDDTTHYQVEKKGLSVYFGDKIILIVADKPDSEIVEYLVRFYCFFREYEAYLYRFMMVDRKIWDRINEIRAFRAVKGRDLPQIRDQLILFKRDVSVIKLRLSQMDNYFQERRADIEKKNLRKVMETYRAYRFEKMESIHEYMTELMNTTEKYVDDAVNLLELLYQESQQKEIATLQVIFLIGAVANFIVLGTVEANKLRLFDVNGQPAGFGNITNFDFLTLLRFGGWSLLVSLIIYLAWHFVFKRIRLHRAISLLEKPTEKDEV